jgi:hypothetical protein
VDYEPIEAFLVGECGMTEEQAGFTTAREFNLKVKARQEEQQSRWELARWQMFLALQMQPFIKSHSKPKDVKAWITFPWERVKEVRKEDCKVTSDEAQQLSNLLSDFLSRQ